MPAYKAGMWFSCLGHEPTPSALLITQADSDPNALCRRATAIQWRYVLKGASWASGDTSIQRSDAKFTR
jgi:hypothetical protein